jgi:hypothetical protein
MLTGSPTYDLTDAEPHRMRNRLASLPDVPSGARVVVRVGALAPEPTAVRVLALHERRLHVDLQGTPFAVRRWLEAIRTNLGEVLL